MKCLALFFVFALSYSFAQKDSLDNEQEIFSFELANKYAASTNYDMAVWQYMNLYESDQNSCINAIRVISRVHEIQPFEDYFWDVFYKNIEKKTTLIFGEIDPANHDSLTLLELSSGLLLASALDSIPLESAEAYYKRASAEENKWSCQAIIDLTKAISIDPQPKYYFLRSEFLINAYDCDRGIPDMVYCYEKGFKREDCAIRLADYYSDCGELEEAMKYCDIVLELNPTISSYWNFRAHLKERNNDFQGAISDYSKAIDLEPDGSYYYYRGQAKFKSGDKQGACNDMRTSEELGTKQARDFLVVHCF